MTSTYTPSFRAQILTRRTYNRPLDDEGTVFETWEQTIDRVIDHQRWLWKRAQGRPLNKGQEAELTELRQLLLDRKVGVAGRTLWLGGTEVAKRRQASQFNCSFLHVETVNDVVDTLWLLLQGCGVGFSPRTGTLSGFTKPIKNIEIVRSTRTIDQWNAGERGRDTNVETWDADTRTWTISVGDSAEAWAKSIGKILAGKYAAEKLVLDFSEIRPAGVRLRGYGWISQGDETISVAYKAICELMNRRAGQLLRKMDIHDIVNWLGTILSTRRSAQISLFEYGSPEWEEFAVCKKDYWSKGQMQRGQSNNSLVFYKKPTRDELKNMFDLMLAAGGSEPGLINGEAALNRAPWFSGLNPCAEILLASKGFCVAGDTPLITKNGIVNIEDAVNKEIEIWNGNRWSKVKPFSTGSGKALYRVTFSDGSYLDATDYHRFSAEVKGSQWENDFKVMTTVDLMLALQKGQTVRMQPFKIEWEGGANVDEEWAYTAGVFSADGSCSPTGTERCIDLYGAKANLPVLGSRNVRTDKERVHDLPFTAEQALEFKKSFDVVFGWSRKAALAFLAGLIDGDGSATSGGGVRVYVSGAERAKKLQLLVRKLGMRSSMNLMSPKGAITNFGPRSDDMYYIQITECQDILCHRVDTSRGHEPVAKGANQIVTSVQLLDGLHETFCFTEPEMHMGVFGNTLTYQCNLVTVDLGKFKESMEDLTRAMYLISRANYRQTCVELKDGILQDAWHENNQFLRLCGVSMTGIARRSDLGPYEFRTLKNYAVMGAYSMADELGTPRPKNVTTIKPEGTGSKIYDTTEGIHKPLAKYIINNVAFGKHDPLVPVLKDANYNVFQHPNGYDWIVSLPVAWEDVEFDVVNGLEVNLESAVSQLERYKVAMDNYVEQNCSITVSYDPTEVDAIIDWLLNNWNHYVGVSFLLRADPTKTAKDLGYPYLPQEPTTKEAYEAYVAGLKPINVEALSEQSEEGVDVGEECGTGACPVR